MKLSGPVWVHILDAYILLFPNGYFILQMFFSGHAISFPSLHLVFSSWLWITISFEHACHNLSHSTIGLWQILWCSLSFALLLHSLSAIYMTCFFSHKCCGRDFPWDPLILLSTRHGTDILLWYCAVTFAMIWHCDLCCWDSGDTFAFLFEHSLGSTH